METLNLSENSQMWLILATAWPLDVDGPFKRRCARRFYVPLPDEESRKLYIQRLIGDLRLEEEQINSLVERTCHFNFDEIKTVFNQAKMEKEKTETSETLFSLLMKFASQFHCLATPEDNQQMETWKRDFG